MEDKWEKKVIKKYVDKEAMKKNKLFNKKVKIQFLSIKKTERKFKKVHFS